MKVEELTWYQQRLTEAVRSVLRAEEMQVAMVNTRITEGQLVEAAVDEAPKLICSETLIFIGHISWREVIASVTESRAAFARTVWVQTIWAKPKRPFIPVLWVMLVVIACMVLIGWAVIASAAVALALASLTTGILQAAPRWWLMDPASQPIFQQQVLAPFLREQINLVANGSEYRRYFLVTSVPSLSDLSGREQIASTVAAERLTKVANAMLTGSIALSGPRGAGKTTLLRGFCDSQFAIPSVPELRVLVSAPVVYDVRDFVVHLYKQLCLAVTRSRAGKTDGVRNKSLRRSRLYIAFAAVLLAAGLALVSGWLAQRASPAQLTQAAYLLLGGVLTALAVMSVVWRRSVWFADTRLNETRFRRRVATLLYAIVAASGMALVAWTLVEQPQRIVLPSTELLMLAGGVSLIVSGSALLSIRARPEVRKRFAPFEEEARRNLQQLEFLQTFTTGHSGALTVPGGVQLGRTVSKQLAQQTLSLPEIVDQYREFASKAGKWWRTQHGGVGKLVIGIDELDKISDVSSAERFINDVKAVFGTPNCLYLVSISDEALLGFQQRSPALRAVFDTAFDEMVRVERLSLSDVRDLLRRRVAGISDPFITLCHVLSGGLPRDVLRTARALVETRSGERADITDMTQALITRELLLIKQALLRDITGDASAPNRQRLLKDLVSESWPRDLMKAAEEYARINGDPTSRWLSVILYYLATVAETFGPDLNHAIEQPEETDLLARARATLAIDSEIASELISRFRDEWGMARPI